MEISGSAYWPCPAIKPQGISGLTVAQMCCRLAKSVRIRSGGISRPAAVAAGPAPGRLFSQLFQKSSIVTVCQTEPAAGALWQADISDIPRTVLRISPGSGGPRTPAAEF
jgi:hypothetical protein